MSEQDKAEIRQIIREELNARLGTVAAVEVTSGYYGAQPAYAGQQFDPFGNPIIRWAKPATVYDGVCQGCSAETSGVKTRIAVPHTCGRQE